MTQRVFVTRAFPEEILRPLTSAFEVDVWPQDEPPSADALRERTRNCEGLLCLLTERIDASLVSACPRLSVVSSMSVGVDHVDVDSLTDRGIALGYTPGVLVETTADLTWALILASARRLGEGERMLRQGGWTRWEPDMLLGQDVHGATLGIVGLGAIGQAVARRAAGFGMPVLGWTRSGRQVAGVESVALDELLARSDIVSIHVALTEGTRDLIDAKALGRMKSTAILVNTARGGIVNESALARALQTGQLAAAGIDVYENEPVSADNPLLAAPNVVLLPHLGSASVATRRRMAALSVDNLVAGLNGQRMPACFNRAALVRADDC